MKVAVIGCGYVGLATAVGLSTIGHHVIGVEHDRSRRDLILAGRPPFHEPGMAEALAEVLDTGDFRVSGELADAGDADIAFLCVQTPAREDGAIDLRYLRQAAAALAALPFDDGQQRRVIVVRSTAVPGTAEGVVAPFFPGAWDPQGTVAVATNPEFLREGSALADFRAPDRVVVGTTVPWAADTLRELYAPLDAPFFASTPTTAEVTKYASNALLATLISFSNELARICEHTADVDVEEVLDLLHLDRRLTPRVDGQLVQPGVLSYLRAGCGFGGSCLPKDVAALSAYAKGSGVQVPLLEAVLGINEMQPHRLVDLAEQAAGPFAGRAVTVLGVAFKGGTDDVRSSPGLAVVDELLLRGATVTLFDPLVGSEALEAYRERGVRIASDLEEAVHGAAACLVTTNAPEFSALSLGDATVVVDGRRMLKPGDYDADRYVAIGRGPRNAASRE